jgi:hypothetical protein
MDYLIKAIIFIPFMLIVYVVVDFFKDILTIAIASVPFSGVLCQFGIFDGLSIFFTILISSFVAKQALSFVK